MLCSEPESQRDIKHVAVDDDGQTQVRREAILADMGVVDQSTLDHVPAQQAL